MLVVCALLHPNADSPLSSNVVQFILLTANIEDILMDYIRMNVGKDLESNSLEFCENLRRWQPFVWVT
jgi:hypothetical protein